MIDKATYDKYARSPEAFRADLIVDVDGTAKRFGQVQDDWQKADFASLDPGLLRCVGRSDGEAITRAYLERPRGHSKTTDLAVTCVYALVFSTRPLRGYAFAADRDQARLIHDAVSNLVRLNPWLSDILELQTHLVINTAENHPGKGSLLKIEASDVGSSFGILPDLIIADELCHWQDSASELWNSLISSAAKRSGCLLCVISNAGFVESWQWRIREAARQDSAWYFSRLDGPVASWLPQSRLDEQRRMLPSIAYARLWLNEWSSGGGDALTREDIDNAFDETLEPMTGGEKNYYFIAGVDLGLVRDSSAVVVLATPKGGKSGRIRLAHHKVWKPIPNRKLDLIDIERHILELDRQFKLENVAADSWQAELLCQQLESDTTHRRRNQKRRFSHEPWVRVINPTPSNLRQQASLTIESFGDGRFQFYECQPLRTDLNKLRVEEKSYGFRCSSPRDGDGHGDTFSAFALALLVAHELAGKKPRRKAGAINPYARNDFDPLELLRKRAMEIAEEESEPVDKMYNANRQLFIASRGARGYL